MKKFIALSLVTLFFVSCSSESPGLEPQEDISTFEDYFSFVVNEETSGALIIYSAETLNSSGRIYSVNSEIKGEKQPLSVNFGSSTLDFTTYEYSQDADKTYSTVTDYDPSYLYGNTYEFTCDNGDVKGVLDNNSKKTNILHFPEFLHVQLSGLSSGKVTAGTTISWTPDASNSKGVVVAIEYNPLNQSDKAVSDARTDRFVVGQPMSDNGSYTITSSDLKDIPDNANISIYVGRADYNIISDAAGTFDYKIAALTTFRSDFTISK